MFRGTHSFFLSGNLHFSPNSTVSNVNMKSGSGEGMWSCLMGVGDGWEGEDTGCDSWLIHNHNIAKSEHECTWALQTIALYLLCICCVLCVCVCVTESPADTHTHLHFQPFETLMVKWSHSTTAPHRLLRISGYFTSEIIKEGEEGLLELMNICSSFPPLSLPPSSKPPLFHNVTLLCSSLVCICVGLCFGIWKRITLWAENAAKSNDALCSYVINN